MVPPEQFEVIKQQFVEHLQREHLAQLAMQAQVRFSSLLWHSSKWGGRQRVYAASVSTMLGWLSSCMRTLHRSAL